MLSSMNRSENISEYGQEMQNSQTTDHQMVPRETDTKTQMVTQQQEHN